MLKITKDSVLERLRRDNPWWTEPHEIPPVYRKWTPRPYLIQFHPLVAQTEVRRAVVLMGPRRVGKTVLIHHAIEKLIRSGIPAHRICYVSIDNPLFNGLGLDDFVQLLGEASGSHYREGDAYVFFDEIQYLRNWEVHLKSLVDSHPELRVTVSGSAAAALKLKSNESGAGRFTDFVLPPLTFFEYLALLGQEDLYTVDDDDNVQATDIDALNDAFVHYLNFGGYPEVLFSAEIQSDPGRYVKADIIDKVLLRDLPSLYGIQDIQELNSLFTSLAFNTAHEVSLEDLSQGSGAAKNTIKRYVKYLEAAFLIRTVERIDRSAKRFSRAAAFKVYLTNPSLRAALFAPLVMDDPAMGHLVETACFSQWFPSEAAIYYARWNKGAQKGEVDIVGLFGDQKPHWAVEVKWSDRIVTHPQELRGMVGFCRKHGIADVLVTTQTIRAKGVIDGLPVEFRPAAEYCLVLGRNIIRQAGRQGPRRGPAAEPRRPD